MLATIFSFKSLLEIINDPNRIGLYLDDDTVSLTIKLAALAILFFYLIFALTVFVQTRRLQSWLRSLKKGHFAAAALAHLILAAVGFIIAIFIL